MATLDLVPVKLDFPRPEVSDPEAELNALLSGVEESRLPKPGGSVALLAGSRKIANLPALLSTLVEFLRGRGLKPFVVPAMGSHGGGTAAGQRGVLAHLGVDSRTVRAPVICMDALARVGVTEKGEEVWADGAALAADAIIPINRVKPHTAFRAPVESGPSKMLAVGLGKGKSAEIMHRAGLAEAIPRAASLLLATGKIPFGVALLENCDGRTAKIALLSKLGWLEREAELLREAWSLYPRLPWAELDLLIVERMGKDISGTGMDLNVIGMGRRFPDVEAAPRISRVVALSLTEGSFGNATGVGYADIVTRKLAEAMDVDATETNCRASGFPEAALLPRVAETEEEALALALRELGNPRNLRAARISDTSSLTELLATKGLLESLPQPLSNAYGELVDNPVKNSETP